MSDTEQITGRPTVAVKTTKNFRLPMIPTRISIEGGSRAKLEQLSEAEARAIAKAWSDEFLARCASARAKLAPETVPEDNA